MGSHKLQMTAYLIEADQALDILRNALTKAYVQAQDDLRGARGEREGIRPESEERVAQREALFAAISELRNLSYEDDFNTKIAALVHQAAMLL